MNRSEKLKAAVAMTFVAFVTVPIMLWTQYWWFGLGLFLIAGGLFFYHFVIKPKN